MSLTPPDVGQHQMSPQQAEFFGAEAAQKDAVNATSTSRCGEGLVCCPLCLGLTNDVSHPKGTCLVRARGSGLRWEAAGQGQAQGWRAPGCQSN